MPSFCLSLTDRDLKKPNAIAAIQTLMNASYETINSDIREVMSNLENCEIGQMNVERCAMDIVYLRTRARHTDALEQQLIELHRLGTPPNIMEFGCPSSAMERVIHQYKNPT